MEYTPYRLNAYFSNRWSCSFHQLQAMSVFMKRYKEEALGVGEVALPGEGGANPPPVIKGDRQKNGAVTRGPGKATIIQSDLHTTTTNGTDDCYKKRKYVSLCYRVITVKKKTKKKKHLHLH